MARDVRTKAICVAVLVESLILPEWVKWTVARIDATDAFELTAVVPAAGVRSLRAAMGSPRGARHLAYEPYEWFDRRVFGPAAVRRMVAGSDILVRPSVMAPDGDMDGIPISLIEAMALGIPVVTTCLSGIWSSRLIARRVCS